MRGRDATAICTQIAACKGYSRSFVDSVEAMYASYLSVYPPAHVNALEVRETLPLEGN